MKRLLLVVLLLGFFTGPAHSVTRNVETLTNPLYIGNSSAVGITVGSDGSFGSSGGRLPNVTTVNAATYDLLITDDILHVTYTSTGVITITWPTAQITRGRVITVKDAGDNAFTYNITIEGEGGELFDGAATAVLNGDSDSVNIYCDGTNLFIY